MLERPLGTAAAMVLLLGQVLSAQERPQPPARESECEKIAESLFRLAEDRDPRAALERIFATVEPERVIALRVSRWERDPKGRLVCERQFMLSRSGSWARPDARWRAGVQLERIEVRSPHVTRLTGPLAAMSEADLRALAEGPLKKMARLVEERDGRTELRIAGVPRGVPGLYYSHGPKPGEAAEGAAMVEVALADPIEGSLIDWTVQPPSR